jgi:hypothetical protein
MHSILLSLLWLAPAADVRASAPADTLVVCPQPLVEALRPWLSHRMAQGRKIVLLTKPESPEKIEAAVKQVANDGRLTHVLIVGDDHPACKEDALLRDATVPTVQVKAKVNVQWGSEEFIASDNSFADLDGDQIPDVSLGRLTADTPDELSTMVKKIIDYETSEDFGPWRRRVNVIAGVGGFGPVTDGILDMATKKFLCGEIPSGYQTSMTFASINSPYCPDPRTLPAAVTARHNEGCLLWVYIGHGQRQWLDSMRVERHAFPIMDVDSVQKLHAKSGSPIAVFLACYTGAFDEASDCLSEKMLAQPSGPVAVICGTRVTMPYANAVLGHAMLEECFAHEHATLGELVLHAKRSAASHRAEGINRQLLDALAAAISPNKEQLGDERLEHLHLYTLLGDPLLRLRRPQPIDLKLNTSATSGDVLELTGTTKIGGRCTIELVCRRDRLTFAAPDRRNFKLTADSLAALNDVYHKANDQRFAAWEIDVAPGEFRSQVKVPELCTGHCHVRAYIQGDSDFALGSADLYVRPRP